jgi:hypothetical protein
LSFVLLGGVFSLPTGERKASPDTASDEVSAYLLAVGLDAPQPMMKAEKNTDALASVFVQSLTQPLESLAIRSLREAPRFRPCLFTGFGPVLDRATLNGKKTPGEFQGFGRAPSTPDERFGYS